MDLKKRTQLIQWAQEKEERFIIEDDYDSEFRYFGKPIPAIQGLYSRGEKSDLYQYIFKVYFS